MAENGALDPVDYAVISQGLIAAAREMGAKLIRSSYSTIIREAADASAALFDREGNVIAQAELIPMQLGTMSDIFRSCMERHPVEEVTEGSFYITNDPYSGGQHLQDVFIYSPIFVEGRLAAFAGTVAHHLDLGGGNPGLTTEAVDVHAEGLIIPPTLYDFRRDWQDGAREGPLQRLIAANIRVPDQTIGDFNAQFAANAIGAVRVRQLCEKYGAATVETAMAELIDYSERRFRAAIAAIPDGTYHGEDAVDDDGLSDKPIRVRAKVTIAGDAIAVDFDGTDPQVGRNLNCPFASTKSATLTAIKSALTSPDIPFNEGAKRPVTITAPKGCLVNPEYPAPVRARMEAGYRCFNSVLKALAQVVPERVIAGGNDTTLVTSISHLEGGRYRVYLEIYGGGFGASPRRDGGDGIDSPLSNCTNTPVEATDMDFGHFRLTGYGLIPDSCGHGRHRGGLGLFRRFEVLKDGVNFAIYADRFRIAPYGLFGGTDAEPARCEVRRGEDVIAVKSKDGLILRKGDILTLYTAGGGGYGPVAERAREAIERDVAQGYVSAEAAARVYGATG
jgi:N-methylhydantoinase B